MDLDHARKRIQEAPDVPGVSEVLLELLELVNVLGNDTATLRQQVAGLQADVEVLAGRTAHAKAVEQEIKKR